MTRDEIDLESALFAPRRSTRWVTVRDHDEFGVEIPVRPPVSHPDGPAMTAALAAAAEAGARWRKSKFYAPGFFG